MKKILRFVFSICASVSFAQEYSNVNMKESCNDCYCGNSQGGIELVQIYDGLFDLIYKINKDIQSSLYESSNSRTVGSNSDFENKFEELARVVLNWKMNQGNIQFKSVLDSSEFYKNGNKVFYFEKLQRIILNHEGMIYSIDFYYSKSTLPNNDNDEIFTFTKNKEKILEYKKGVRFINSIELDKIKKMIFEVLVKNDIYIYPNPITGHLELCYDKAKAKIDYAESIKMKAR